MILRKKARGCPYGEVDILSRRQTGKTTFTSCLTICNLRYKLGQGYGNRAIIMAYD